MSGRSRSKSPARKTRANPISPAASPAAAASPAKPAAAEGSPLDDPMVQSAITVAVLVAVWSQSGSAEAPSLSGFAAAAGAGFDFNVPDVPVVGSLIRAILGASFNFVATFHVLNTIVENTGGSGGWLNNFATTVVSAFAGVIAPAVLGGNGTLASIFTDQAGMSLTRFFVLWYFLNYDIPGCPVNFGLWSKIAGIGGAPLQNLLNFASAMFTTNLIVAAAGDAVAPLSTAWFAAIAGAVVVGSAGDFFPLSKGFSLASSGNAFNIAFFLASGGFGFLDFLIHTALDTVSAVSLGHVTIAYEQNFGALINETVTGPFGGAAQFVVVVSALNLLVGHMIPLDLKPGFDVFGIVGKVVALFQLA